MAVGVRISQKLINVVLDALLHVRIQRTHFTWQDDTLKGIVLLAWFHMKLSVCTRQSDRRPSIIRHQGIRSRNSEYDHHPQYHFGTPITVKLTSNNYPCTSDKKFIHTKIINFLVHYGGISPDCSHGEYVFQCIFA